MVRKVTLEKILATSPLQVQHFDLDQLHAQLEQMGAKIHKVGELSTLKQYEPVFTLMQSGHDHAKQ